MAEVPPDISSADRERQAEAERQGLPFLVFRDTNDHQQVVELGELGRITVGRGSASEIWLSWDQSVSRLHAEFESVGDFWTVADEGLSHNGTYLNDERIAGRRRLTDGDRIRIGSTTMVYRAPREPSSRATIADETQT